MKEPLETLSSRRKNSVKVSGDLIMLCDVFSQQSGHREGNPVLEKHLSGFISKALTGFITIISQDDLFEVLDLFQNFFPEFAEVTAV